jgi:hypothetical protein
MKTATKRQINFTVIFSDDEEHNQIAFEDAVKCILFGGEEEKVTNSNEKNY